MPVPEVTSSTTTTGRSDQGFLSDKTLEQLGRNEFLTLLITQLRYQDPLNPAKDTEFVAQLAQFSQLQETRNLSEAMRESSMLSTASSAASLIGRTVLAEIHDANTGQVVQVAGQVTHITLENGVPQLVIGNTSVSLSDVKAIV